MVVVPGILGLCTFSPPLDARGNSVRGIQFCKQLNERFNFHIFNQIVGTGNFFGDNSIFFFKFHLKNIDIGELLSNKEVGKEDASEATVEEACDAAFRGDIKKLEALVFISFLFFSNSK